MRDIPEELTTRLASGVTTLAHAWRVARRDGQVFGFTDHDRALSFASVTYEPLSGFEAGAIDKSVGLNVDSAFASGALDSDTITEADLAAGLWDGARVDIYKLDWTDTSRGVHLFAGRFGEARRGALAFEIELRGLQAPLNVPVGRVFSRFCDANVGDARCGVDLGTFSGEGAVIEQIGARAFRVSGLDAFVGGYFSRGRMSWSGGAGEIATHRDDVIELVEAPIAAPTGAVTLTAGCDKRSTTCHAKFVNIANFRGFPHMPGNDAIQTGPDAARNDGSSRWR